MKTDKDLMMYYHATLRNVGLFTSISFATLTYSRYYRHKIASYDILLLIVSIIFIVLSLIINYFLILDFEVISMNNKDLKMSRKWIIIPNITFFVNLFIMILSIITLFRRLNNKI